MSFWLWLTVFLLLASVHASAQPRLQTISATHTYFLGDNDSKSDARQQCFLEAKRRVLEQAGVYIESHTVVKNLQLSKSEVVAYSAAVLRVETSREDYGLRDGRASLACIVKADVDMADIERRLAAIAGDKSLQARISEQQRQIRDLEHQLRELNVRVNATPPTASGQLRKERNVIFENLQELENKKLAALRAITEKTATIRRYIVRNMTRDEVRGILGQPRGQWAGNWNYGELWICFAGGGLVEAVGRDQYCRPNELR